MVFLISCLKAIAVFGGYLAAHYMCAWWLPFSSNGNAIVANAAAVTLLITASLGLGRDPLKTLGGARFPINKLLVAIGLGLGTCFLVRLMMITVPFPASWSQQYTSRVEAVETSAVWLRYIAVMVVAPLAEELVFRGVIYRMMRGGMHAVFAATLSSALFAVLHGTPVWMLYTFFLGVVLCVVYERTQSVWMCAVCHAAFNIMGQIPLIGVLPNGVVVVVFAMGVMMFALSLWRIWRRPKETES